MDSEHYIDGQHNGGVFNHYNHNVYGYCYQNPIKLVDPNGKQALSGAASGFGIGVLTEFLSIFGSKIVFEGMGPIDAIKDFKTGDWTDVAVGGAMGALSGVIDNGIGKFADWICKRRNQKILVFILESVVELAENAIKQGLKMATGEEKKFDLAGLVVGALAEVGMARLLSLKFLKKEMDKAVDTVKTLEKKLNKEKSRKSPIARRIANLTKELDKANSWKKVISTITIGAETTSKAIGNEAGETTNNIINSKQKKKDE